MRHITLTTDFGTRDGYAAVMKGVIWTIAPGMDIIDITHEITPQNILEGALTLKRTLPFFPPGCVHIAVVDPGVGSQRRPIAARVGAHYLVGPDNGLFWLMIEHCLQAGQSLQAVHLDQPRYWLREVSQSFHGRDIFAPVGAHLISGVSLEELGSPVNDLVKLGIPTPQATQNGWQGSVIHTDVFGNLATNLERQHIPEDTDLTVRIGGQIIEGLSRAYAERAPGEFVAIFDSDGMLSLAVVNGSAAQKLGAGIGAPVEVTLRAGRRTGDA